MTDQKRAASAQPKPETNGDLAVGLVLDKSGSMGFMGLAQAAVAGYNEYIQELREQEGETIFSLTLFDTDFHQPHIAVPLTEVEPLDHTSYQTGGNTALYDAIAFTVKDLEKRLVKLGRADMKVLVVTLTDGEENSSTDFNAEALAELVREYEAKGNWTFVYIGLGQSKEYVGSVRGLGYTGDSGYYPGATGQAVAGTMSALATATGVRRSSSSMRSDNVMADAGLSVNEDEAEQYANAGAETGNPPPRTSLSDHLNTRRGK